MDIVWVSQNANDVSFRTALTNAGHHVPWQAKRYETLDATKLAELNAADLIIVARNTSSGNFTNGTEVHGCAFLDIGCREPEDRWTRAGDESARRV